MTHWAKQKSIQSWITVVQCFSVLGSRGEAFLAVLTEEDSLAQFTLRTVSLSETLQSARAELGAWGHSATCCFSMSLLKQHVWHPVISLSLFLSSVERAECSISLQSAALSAPLGRSLVSLVCAWAGRVSVISQTPSNQQYGLKSLSSA